MPGTLGISTLSSERHSFRRWAVWGLYGKRSQTGTVLFQSRVWSSPILPEIILGPGFPRVFIYLLYIGPVSQERISHSTGEAFLSFSGQREIQFYALETSGQRAGSLLSRPAGAVSPAKELHHLEGGGPRSSKATVLLLPGGRGSASCGAQSLTSGYEENATPRAPNAHGQGCPLPFAKLHFT